MTNPASIIYTSTSIKVFHTVRPRLLLFPVAPVLITILIALMFIPWNLNSYRPEIERTLNQLLGVTVIIDGDLTLSIRLQPDLRADNIRIRDGKLDVANIGKLSASFALLPLLQGEFQLHQLIIDQSDITLSPDNWPLVQRKNMAAPTRPMFIWKNVPGSRYEISHSTLGFHNKESPWYIAIDDLNLALTTTVPLKTGVVSTILLNGDLQAQQVRTKLAAFDRLKMHLSYEKDKFTFTDISTRLFMGEGHGDFSIDFRQQSPHYQLNFKLQEMAAALSLNRLAKQGLIEGPLSLYADLHWQGTDSKSMLANLNGVFNLYGERLVLHRINLDKTINNFNKSQRFNLVDLGAYFFIGPMGTIATKGYSFAKLSSLSTTDSSQIMYLISDWELTNGIAKAADVALSTPHNRIALQGRLDIPNGRYDGIVFALINKQGCASMSQRISGAFEAPRIEQPEMLSVFAAPVRDVLETPKKIFTSKSCTPFYTGRLEHPITR